MKLMRRIYRIILFTLLQGFIITQILSSQPVPGKEENIPFLVTFGKSGKTSWGDDSFYSVWFFSISKEYSRPFYIRVFDPDCGGAHDEIQGEFNTRTLFSVYGGAGVDPEKDSNKESRGDSIGMNYKKGNLLSSRLFGNEARTDNKYHTFGPFNPTDGDFNVKWNSYIFKVVCEGVSGDDGNLYKYYLSSNADNDVPLEGANAFTYKYIFRMWNDFKSVAHIYPYIDSGVISVKQSNFDWDTDGKILVVSRYKQGVGVPISGEDDWINSVIPVEPDETDSSLDFQFHKKQGELVKNNNVVVTLKNQWDESMPFYSSPIGGVPVYEPLLSVKKVIPKK
jgi:hypothetical protein